jgi:hypothetical protein
MKFLILSLSLFLNNNFISEKKETDEEVFRNIVELEKLLILHKKKIFDCREVEPSDCEFPISTREDILNFYKKNNSKVKIIYDIDSCHVLLTIKDNSFSYIVLMD